MKPELKFVIPSKGLLLPLLQSFKESGFSLPGLESGRKLTEIDPKCPEVQFCLRQTRDIATKIFDGMYDAGITGSDRLVEDGYARIENPQFAPAPDARREYVKVPGTLLVTKPDPNNLKIIDTFSFARTGPQAAKFVLAGSLPEGATLESLLKNSERIRIGTEYVKLAGQLLWEKTLFFPKKNTSSKEVNDVGIEYVKSNGATEAMIESGEADLIADVMETGTTLGANKIKVLESLMDCEPALIAVRKTLKDPSKASIIEMLRLAIRTSVISWKNNRVEISMNVPEETLGKIFEVLPSMKSPTIAPLINPQQDPSAKKWCSVTTVMTRLELTQLAPKLLKLEATDITQKSLERVIS